MAHAARKVAPEEFQLPADSRWRRLPAGAGLLGLFALSFAYMIRGDHVERFYHSWLVAFLFCVSITLGALFFVLVHFAAKAGWGVVVRRLAESLAAVVPLYFLLFVPILLHLPSLYHWADAEHAAHDPVLAGKAAWLNPTMFGVRAVIYLGAWSILAWSFLTMSRRQDRTGDETLTRRMIALSGPGLIVFALTLTFAAFDWIMSLEPHWYSTIYGVYWFAGSLVGVFATLILISMALTRSGVLRQVITIEHFHDLGKLLYTFMVFWTYIGFSQFFLIWYADLPEETFWYLKRLDSGWKTLTIALAIGHFAVPFFFLMSEHVKRRRVLLAAGASWMLLMHLLDMYWLVMPGFLEQGPDLRPLDLLILIGFVALSLAAFGLVLGRQALVPSRDPRLVESMGFENV